MKNCKNIRRAQIKKRVRGSISRGTAQRPRMSVFRSNKDIYVQLIDDVNGVTLTSASSLKMDGAHGIPKIEQAKMVGKKIAENAQGAGINAVVFDRNGYLYHGRVKSLAEAAREGGLKF